MGYTVQLWFLQPDAHIHTDRTDRDGSVQTKNLVHLLPYGHHDPGNMPVKENKITLFQHTLTVPQGSYHILLKLKYDVGFNYFYFA